MVKVFRSLHLELKILISSLTKSKYLTDTPHIKCGQTFFAQGPNLDILLSAGLILQFTIVAFKFVFDDF